MKEMKLNSIKKRKQKDKIIKVVSVLGAISAISILLWIVSVVVIKGYSSINWAFFTELPTPPGMKGGGMANAIIGTLIMTAVGAVIAIPIGIMAGVYLAEFGKNNRFAESIRFTTNVLVGVPSIIVGVFVYTLIVVPMNHFSGIAGAVSLAVIMLPVVIRTTEDMLSMVPDSLRESSLALGIPRWRTTIGVVFRTAKNGMVTGVLLAVARVSGETAPLLFTALNSPFWADSLLDPTPNLTVTMFHYAMSPYADWQAKAWGASLLITGGVLILTITARIIVSQNRK